MYFFANIFVLAFLNQFEGREHNSLIVSTRDITASFIEVFQIQNPLNNHLKQTNAKICNRDVANNEKRTHCCAMWTFGNSAYGICTQQVWNRSCYARLTLSLVVYIGTPLAVHEFNRCMLNELMHSCTRFRLTSALWWKKALVLQTERSLPPLPLPPSLSPTLPRSPYPSYCEISVSVGRT